MKTKRTHMLALAVGITTGSCFLLGAVTPPPATTLIRWDFPVNTTLAVPQPPAGGAVAQIVPGPFASGWLGGASLFGKASGLWDLGRQGTITLSGLDAWLGDSTAERIFRVRVVYFQDDVFYAGPGQVTVPGAQLIQHASATVGVVDEGPLSQHRWMENVTEWKLPAGVPAPSVIYTAEYDGSVVDSVAVENATVPTVPVRLAIRPVAGEPPLLELSWPASVAGAVLEVRTAMGDAEAWSVLEVTPVVRDGLNTVFVPASASQQYFRLRR